MIPHAAIAAAAAALALTCGAVATMQEPSMSSRRANGTFTFAIRPPSGADATTDQPDAFVHVRIDKVFEGGLSGTSVVEMLASNAGDTGTGGYVALERFTGSLGGRRGTFVMQHSGTMSPKGMHIDVQVSPGSGTGELAGLEGQLTIRIEGKQHFYTLDYSVPGG